MKKNKHITQAVLIIGALAVVAYYLFDNPPVEAMLDTEGAGLATITECLNSEVVYSPPDLPVCKDGSPFAILGYSNPEILGSSNPDNRAFGIASTFKSRGNLYVVWVKVNDERLYYSSIPMNSSTETNWSDSGIIKEGGADNNGLGSDWGVQAFNQGQAEDAPICLFTKGAAEGQNGATREGGVFFTCLSDHSKFPIFPLKKSFLNKKDIDYLPSVVAMDSEKMYYAVSRVQQGSWPDNERYVQYLVSRCVYYKDKNEFSCKTNTQTFDPDHIDIKRDPGITAFDNGEPFVFSRSIHEKIQYEQISPDTGHGSGMKFFADEYRTKTLISARHFIDKNGEEYIYVAYKNYNAGDQLSFARIKKADLTSGIESWQHCNFVEGQYAGNDQPPALFDHNKKLYILFPNAKDNHVISYQRIDNRCRLNN